jgi:2,3-dihydroxybenzoate-AMP ligase
VSAEEVEAYLVSHPSVREAAVIALPEPDLGERTCAVVVAHGEPPALAALKAYLAELGVAPYKAPDQLEIVDALPRTSLGKVNKAALREEFTG